MKREIKFRGKVFFEGIRKKVWSKWIYGQLVKDLSSEGYTILEEPIEWIDGHEWRGEIPYEIEQNTIGQYTGLKDKNGVEIYEGDIVEWDSTFKAPVEYENGEFYPISEQLCWDKEVDVKIIGNIYDNPELLDDEL